MATILFSTTPGDGEVEVGHIIMVGDGTTVGVITTAGDIIMAGEITAVGMVDGAVIIPIGPAIMMGITTVVEIITLEETVLMLDLSQPKPEPTLTVTEIVLEGGNLEEPTKMVILDYPEEHNQ